MTFSCEGGFIGPKRTLTVRGSALAKVEPVNLPTSSYVLTLATSTNKWVPALTEYEDESGAKKSVGLEVQEVVKGTAGPWRSGAFSAESFSWATSWSEIMA